VARVKHEKAKSRGKGNTFIPKAQPIDTDADSDRPGSDGAKNQTGTPR